ncbi:MAG TPA: 16S rRNA (cytidine(1402)-2'-O)-methyltransferase [Bacillota bacterium]
MTALYVCATPIGNLEDVTLRLLRVLRDAAVIGAEDTRRTRRLCARYGIETPLVSCHEHNEHIRAREFLAHLAAGRSVAYVTDAGTPGISDPGAALVRHVREAGFPVVPVPGPSAVTAALSASGFAADAFCVGGFLPRKGRARREALERMMEETRPIVLFEAPHRIAATLADLGGHLGDRPLCVARELTKEHETICVLPAREAAERLAGRELKGELTLVVGPATPDPRTPEANPDDAEAAGLPLAAEVALLVNAGLTEREAIRRVARGHGLSRRVVYARVKGESGR